MLIEAITAFVSGGGTGLLGSAIGRGIGIFEQKQKNKALALELEHERKLHEMQLQDNREDREKELSIVYSQADSQNIVASYQHDSSYSNSALRWVRPFLTVLLVGLSGAIYFVTADPAIKLSMGNQIVYLAGLAVAWWFADRSGRQQK